MADVMTKNLPPKVHWRLVSPMMGMPIPHSVTPADLEVEE